MCFEIIKPLEGLRCNDLQRQRAINSYYSNPVFCKHCGSLIQIKCGEKASYTKNKKFCDHVCAGVYNNKAYPKREKLNVRYCSCGGLKSRTSKRCSVCKRSLILEKTLKELKRNAYPHWNKVRTHARKVLERSDIVKTCSVCRNSEFDEVVEVCHIKDISEFDQNTKIKVVNSLSNLVYLCPSHHALFDRKLISVRF